MYVLNGIFTNQNKCSVATGITQDEGNNAITNTKYYNDVMFAYKLKSTMQYTV
jgi:hypothetical protein